MSKQGRNENRARAASRGGIDLDAHMKEQERDVTRRALFTPKYLAAYDLLGRVGAASVETRYSGSGDTGEDDPIVWICVFEPRPELGQAPGSYECAAGANPEAAIMRLCEALIDGGQCMSCLKPCGFDASMGDHMTDATGAFVCWYLWDPSTSKFMRSCD